MAYVVFSAAGYGVESPGALAWPDRCRRPTRGERRRRLTVPLVYFLAFTWTLVKIGSPSWPYVIFPNTFRDWPELFL